MYKVEEDCKIVNVDVNNTGFKCLKKWLCKCFMRNEMYENEKKT